jgi:peroxiredoxin
MTIVRRRDARRWRHRRSRPLRSASHPIVATALPRRGHRFVIVALAVAWVSVCLVGAGDVRAQEPRFVPWHATSTPALALRDVSGGQHTLPDYRGHVVLVNFWATWCEYCTDEVASLKGLREQLAGRPLAILLVNYGESPAKVRDYAKRLSPGVPVLLDPGQDAAKAWRVHMIPSSFVVDVEGRVRYSVIGNLDWTSEEAARTVRALLP